MVFDTFRGPTVPEFVLKIQRINLNKHRNREVNPDLTWNMYLFRFVLHTRRNTGNSGFFAKSNIVHGISYLPLSVLNLLLCFIDERVHCGKESWLCLGCVRALCGNVGERGDYLSRFSGLADNYSFGRNTYARTDSVNCVRTQRNRCTAGEDITKAYWQRALRGRILR